MFKIMTHQLLNAESQNACLKTSSCYTLRIWRKRFKQSLVSLFARYARLLCSSGKTLQIMAKPKQTIPNLFQSSSIVAKKFPAETSQPTTWQKQISLPLSSSPKTVNKSSSNPIPSFCIKAKSFIAPHAIQSSLKSKVSAAIFQLKLVLN